MFAVTPSVFSVFDFEAKSWRAHKASNTMLYQCLTLTTGQFSTHLGPLKPKKLSQRFGRILITGSKAVSLGEVEATAKLRTSPGKPSRSGMSG
jgi:hypothetical protein